MSFLVLTKSTLLHYYSEEALQSWIHPNTGSEPDMPRVYGQWMVFFCRRDLLNWSVRHRGRRCIGAICSGDLDWRTQKKRNAGWSPQSVSNYNHVVVIMTFDFFCVVVFLTDEWRRFTFMIWEQTGSEPKESASATGLKKVKLSLASAVGFYLYSHFFNYYFFWSRNWNVH